MNKDTLKEAQELLKKIERVEDSIDTLRSVRNNVSVEIASIHVSRCSAELIWFNGENDPVIRIPLESVSIVLDVLEKDLNFDLKTLTEEFEAL